MKKLPRTRPEFRDMTSLHMKLAFEQNSEESDLIFAEIRRLMDVYRTYFFRRRRSGQDDGRPVARVFRGFMRRRGMAEIEVVALTMLRNEMTGLPTKEKREKDKS